MSDLGIVVIGRNEGQRLLRCLQSSRPAGCPVVYVDSGSTDGSIENARSAGAAVVQLDRTIAFTAARARNAGLAHLLEMNPAVRLVQFVDGDCEIEDGWLERARAALDGDQTVAIVCGGLRERSPQASIYNRLGDLEWRKPAGEIRHCGGLFMIRVEVFRRVGGFDPTIAAGEEPDLCCRIRQAGFRVVRLDCPMATHDLDMMRFSQWWRRSVRGGYGALKLTLFGPVISRGAFRSQVRSTLVWGIGLPIAAIVAFGVVSAVGAWPWSLSLLAMWPVCLTLQGLRLSRKARQNGCSAIDALAYAAFTLLWKYAALIGFARCLIDHRAEQTSSAKVTREFHKTAA
jgi:glycosyltransferase involved in cell wall biosynthesis